MYGADVPAVLNPQAIIWRKGKKLINWGKYASGGFTVITSHQFSSNASKTFKLSLGVCNVLTANN